MMYNIIQPLSQLLLTHYRQRGILQLLSVLHWALWVRLQASASSHYVLARQTLSSVCLLAKMKGSELWREVVGTAGPESGLGLVNGPSCNSVMGSFEV